MNYSIYPGRKELGIASAEHVIDALSAILATQDTARVIFACAPSQNEFLSSLVELSKGRLDWSRVIGFHMDEYVGLEATHPASFRRYLHEHFLSKVELKEFHAIAAEATDSLLECNRYTALIAANRIDLICLGIGENGHLAFNDPPVADFEDSVLVKVVQLDEVCRQQQVHDGCFETLADVPRHAITLTLPVFRDAKKLSVVVPGQRKAYAVAQTLQAPISTNCPSTMLRNHPDVTLFIDRDSASELRPEFHR